MNMDINLKPLFAKQRELDEKINRENALEGIDLFDKKTLSLQTELGELSNEWRGFKFWSKDQVPKNFKRIDCPECKKKGYYRGNPPVDKDKGVHGLGNHWYDCDTCEGFLVTDTNPLLEEYVDCLHFFLSIGIEMGLENKVIVGNVQDGLTIIDLFNRLHRNVGLIHHAWESNNMPNGEVTFLVAFDEFLHLGEMLGFTWDQIEEAYFKKNEINHIRQQENY